jgi:hypothetical protein
MLETLEAFFRRVWIEGDATAIPAFMMPDGRYLGLAGEAPMTTEGFTAFQAMIRTLVSDIDFEIEQRIESDGWIAVLCSFTGTAVSSGKRVTTTGSIHARISDGKIHEAYNHFDFIRLFAELDLLPADTLERCLSGQRVG